MSVCLLTDVLDRGLRVARPVGLLELISVDALGLCWFPGKFLEVTPLDRGLLAAEGVGVFAWKE